MGTKAIVRVGGMAAPLGLRLLVHTIRYALAVTVLWTGLPKSKEEKNDFGESSSSSDARGSEKPRTNEGN